jgi:tetrapyrrole methylase family protein/MazG family protein
MDKYYLSPSNDPERGKKLAAFDRLLTIMDELRDQCPWDKKQTLDSLRYLTIEEVYELSESIISKDYQELEKELGDIMLHIVFYAKIGSEKNLFNIESVLTAISEKLIHRHPHIYGDIKVTNEQEVKENWEKIKLKEKGNKSVLGGVPKSLPALVKAMRIQEKTKGVGFEWDKKEQVWQKVEEELQEFVEQVKKPAGQLDKEEIENEFGDLLFSLINYARFINVSPEDALERTNKKFINRFNHIEQEAKKKGRSLPDMSLIEMEVLWNEAKKEA